MVVGFLFIGVNEFLLMIWGEVENIFLRVEGLEIFYVDRTSGLVFKVGCGEESLSGILRGRMVF